MKCSVRVGLVVSVLSVQACSAASVEPGEQVALGVSEAALSGGAAVQLLATGSLSGAGADRSSETAGALENGVPGNLLGGIGSGLAYVGGNKFLALPDRGPNAKPYNAAVDETTSYIPRFHTLKLRLQKNEDGAALPFALTPELKKTTLLFEKNALVYGSGSAVGLGSGAPALNSKNKNYFSGRSDNFDASKLSTDSKSGRLDPESLRVSNDGESVYISDEYGPFVYQFDRSSGKRTGVFTLPSEFAISKLSPKGDLEISGNTSGRVANKGMEGLAITPDGHTLVGAMQSPLLQDKGTDGRFARLVSIPVDGGGYEQFAYELTNIGTEAKPKYPTISDMVAINDHEFLVDERDGKGLGDDSAAAFKRIYHIDTSAAVDVSGISGDANLAGKAVPKSLLIDVVAVLNASGIASTEIPAKLEGLAFGREVRVDKARKLTLFLSSDNDFLSTITDTKHPSGIENPNRFFVFGIDAEALSGFETQRVKAEEDSE